MVPHGQDYAGDDSMAKRQRIAAELQHPQPQTVIDAGAAVLFDLQGRDIVLGVRR